MIKIRTVPSVKVGTRWVNQSNVQVIKIETAICGDYATFQYKGKVYGSYVYLCKRKYKISNKVSTFYKI